MSLASIASPTFADHAAAYRAGGLIGALLMPAGKKFPPPSGFTGKGGRWPTDEDIAAWSERAGADFNLALRLPEDIIGIDVDAYDDKPGAATLADAESRWGVLPATYVSSARDFPSGIRLYRIPTGLDWPNEVGPGIETVRHGHRYVVASPSINPKTGTAYRWTAPGGSTVDVPDLAQVPELPDAWIAGLTGGRAAGPRLTRSDVDVDAWLDNLADGEPCIDVVEVLDRARLALFSGGSRYEAMRDATMALVVRGHAGCSGVARALHTLQGEYEEVVSGESERDAYEWQRSLRGAVEKAAGLVVEEYEQCAVLQYERLRLDAPEGWVPQPRKPQPAAAKAKDQGEPRLAAEDVVEFIEANYHLGRSTDGVLIAVPTYPGAARIARDIKSIRSDVLRRFREDRKAKTGRGVILGTEMLTNALSAVHAYAEEAEPEPVALRAAQVSDSRVVLDLGHADGTLVDITPEGWELIQPSEDTPLFRRSSATSPLPIPERGGTTDALRELLGLDAGDRRWKLVRGWLTAALFAEIPRPMLWFTGSQGSGKSTRARMVLSMIEPVEGLGKEPGRNERDDSIAAMARFVVSYDNITTVSKGTSDWICRLVTGVTDDRRGMYTQDDLRAMTYKRTGVATSITIPPGLGSDALERVALVPLDRVPDTERRGERGIWSAFETERARLLGAILDDVVLALRQLPAVSAEVRSWPRMADFGMVLAALDRSLGLGDDAGHLAAYTGAVNESLADRALDDPLTSAVLAFVEQHDGK